MSHLFGEPDGFSLANPADVNPLLAERHYLGPISSGGYELIVAGWLDGEVVGAQVWRRPTSRHLPRHWLELSRWCLTPELGKNGGSRMHAWSVRRIKQAMPEVTTLVSYSDPSVGHTGALYKACNWRWAPTWHRLRPPPTGNGEWTPGAAQSVKDRWVFEVRRDRDREGILAVDDQGALRAWAAQQEARPA